MTLSTRLIASLCVGTGLLLAGCSGDSPEATPSDSTTSAGDTAAPETGGSCEAAVDEASATESAAAEPDEAASQETLGAVGLSDDAAAAPTATFDAPMPITSEVVQITDEGDGEAITEGQLITFNYLVCDIVTGEKLHSTWGTSADADAPETHQLAVNNFGPVLTESLDGATVGSRLLWGQPGLTAEQSTTGEAINGVLYVLSVADAQTIPDSASGTEVTPTDDSLPAITFTDGKPAVSVPSSFEDPTELVVEPLIESDGATVEAGQRVQVKYTGWLTDGTQFDSSWDREAPKDVLTFQAGAGRVIPGWDQGVVGQKVGHRVLLVVPSEMGYGSEGQGEAIPGDSTLIFVVDILAAY